MEIRQTAQITTSELATRLEGLRGATIISLTWGGEVKPRYVRDKGRITSVSLYSGMVNPHYDRKKAKALGIPLEEVEVTPCEWLTHLGGPVSVHNGGKQGESNPLCGTKYVTFYPQSGHTDYVLDGAPCERGAVADMLKPSSGGPVSNFRRVTLEKVVAASIGGVDYTVVPDPA